MKKAAIILLACVGIASCIFDFRAKKIYKNYYLVITDTKSQTSLDYKLENGSYIERIAARVTGYFVVNDEWLLVRQEDEGKNNFYILCVKKDNGYTEVQRVVEGPYDISTFTAIVKQRFGVGNVVFSE